MDPYGTVTTTLYSRQRGDMLEVTLAAECQWRRSAGRRPSLRDEHRAHEAREHDLGVKENLEQRISIERLEQAVNIFGSFDENIRLLEQEFHVTVVNRDGELRVEGEAEDTMLACKAIQALLTLSSRGEAIGEQNVRYVIGLVRSGKETQISELTGDVLCISAKGRPIKPKTIGQKEYIKSVLKTPSPSAWARRAPARRTWRWPPPWRPSGTSRSTASS